MIMGSRGKRRATNWMRKAALGSTGIACALLVIGAYLRTPTGLASPSESGTGNTAALDERTQPPAIGSAGTERSAQEWALAGPGYQYAFPRDHASHEPYKIEWWYYTGNLESSDGRPFGFQLTFFRTGVEFKPENPSRWAVRDLYMAQFAISDLSKGAFHSYDRLNRAGVGWAGADTASYHVWNEDWDARLEGTDHVLKARDGDLAVDLRLRPQKPVVIHGENGISQKGPGVGNASHYYSISRLLAEGVITAGGQRFAVRGLSWMDHEFGTSMLEPGEVGWDWFSIQLDDGRDVMIFQIRHADGSIDPHSSGTIIDASGRATHIPFGQFSLTPGQRWHSAASGASYPIDWVLEVPAYDLHLLIDARAPDQELRTADSAGITYWEGSVAVSPGAGGANARGLGYLEMTGYADSGIPEALR
jgi:predicted secreted hydrolase